MARRHPSPSRRPSESLRIRWHSSTLARSLHLMDGGWMELRIVSLSESTDPEKRR
jgi:hypothetical protein